jgi:hypothetical protein
MTDREAAYQVAITFRKRGMRQIATARISYRGRRIGVACTKSWSKTHAAFAARDQARLVVDSHIQQSHAITRDVLARLVELEQKIESI